MIFCLLAPGAQIKNRNEGAYLSSSTLLVGLERGRVDFVPGASIDPIDNADE
jgi:hypothetical protein